MRARCAALPRRPQRGVHLIEALVSLLAMSVGALALLGGFSSVQRAALGVHESTSLNHHAHEFAERMRANRAGVEAGAYDYLDDSDTGSVCTSGCSPAAQALSDYLSWRGSVRTSLSEAIGVVCRDSTPEDGVPASPACDSVGQQFAVKIWWDGDRTGTMKRYVLAVRP